MLVGFILNIVFNLTLRFLYARENKIRDRALEGKTEEEIEALREESRKQGFENVTDKENVSYIFLSRHDCTTDADNFSRYSSDMCSNSQNNNVMEMPQDE